MSIGVGLGEKMRLFDDTRPEAEKVYIDLMNQAPIWKKVGAIDGLYLTAFSMLRTSICRRYPGINPVEIRTKMAEILLGEEYGRRLYGAKTA